MSKNAANILKCLSQVKGNGTFAVSGEEDFVLLGLNVEKVGEVALPINEIQVKELIKVAHKAPFGKGAATITDTSVRSAWEINANQIKIKNPAWETFLAKLLDKVKVQLGLQKQKINATLYKMLIYEKDDFFVWHKDSEKEKNMFATLSITLPSNYAGGKLAVKFNGQEIVIDNSEAASNYKFGYAAFYADCDHEVRPLLSGHRVCLVYNLLQTAKDKPISATDLTKQIDEMAALLEDWKDDFEITESEEENEEVEDVAIKTILLGHQYTPTNFSLESLKLDDIPRVQVMLQAAEKAGFFARLALVTHYKSGSLEEVYYKKKPKSRYGSYEEYDDNEIDGVMDEIFDEHISIENWCEDGLPTLGNVMLEETQILTNKPTDADEPIEKQAEGYTGNAGMTIDYWYHHGAVVFWRKEDHATVLNGLGLAQAFEWVDFYSKNIGTDKDAHHYLTTLLNNMEEIDTTNKNSYFTIPDASCVAKGWVQLAHQADFNKKTRVFVPLFDKINKESWLGLLSCYSEKSISNIFEEVNKAENIDFANHFLNILLYIEEESAAYKDFVHTQITEIPSYFANLANYILPRKDEEHRYYFNKDAELKQVLSAKNLVVGLLKVSLRVVDNAKWTKSIYGLLTTLQTREYVNEVLAAALLTCPQYKEKPLFEALEQFCSQDLEKRTAKEPQPLPNWTREVPTSKSPNQQEMWNILSAFLKSSTETVFNFTKNESERSTMESAIKNVTIDLKLETIKSGRPYTLQITKTRAAYGLELSKWKEDLKILADLKKI
jgi:hypothetical protein